MSVPGFSVTMFEKVLVANRGEIAVRILRTLKEMGIESVAVYSEADVEALPARLADEAVLIGPPAPAQSYLNVESVLAAARQTGASAIHPGYGFLSENAKFAEACATAGLTFIGPSPESLRLAGNKLQARRSVESAGVPVIPGSNQPLRELSVARRLAASIGYPAMLKAVAGGGGKGIRSIADEDTLVEAFRAFSRSTSWTSRPSHSRIRFRCSWEEARKPPCGGRHDWAITCCRLPTGSSSSCTVTSSRRTEKNPTSSE